jgi:hypothetical protein
MFSEDAVFLFLVGEVGDGLDGLTQSHIVGEDAVGVLGCQVDHPLQGLKLVFFEFPANEQARLRDLEVAAVLVQKLMVCLGLDRVLDPLDQFLEQTHALQLLIPSFFHSNIISQLLEVILFNASSHYGSK